MIFPIEDITDMLNSGLEVCDPSYLLEHALGCDAKDSPEAVGVYRALRDESDHIVDFLVEWASPAAYEVMGFASDQQVGRRVSEFLPQDGLAKFMDDFRAVVEHRRVVQRKQPLAQPSLVGSGAMGSRSFSVTFSPIENGFVASCRRSAEEAEKCGHSKKDSSCFADLARVSREGIAVVDVRGVVLFANPVAESLLGCAPGEAVGFDLGAPAAREHSSVIEIKDGKGPATIELRAAETTWQGVPAYVVSLHHTTDAKRSGNDLREANERLAHLKRVLEAIRDVNRLIVRANDRSELIQETAEILVKSRAFDAAWIALQDQHGAEHGQAGLDSQKCFAMVSELGRTGRPRCYAHLASGVGSARMEVGSNCDGCPLMTEVTGSAAVSTPLRHGDRHFGFFTAYLPAAVADDPHAATLFQQIAEDLAVALHGLELEESRSRAERLLRETERIAHVGGWEWDFKTNEVTLSDECMRIYGATRRRLPCSELLSYSHPEDREAWSAAMEATRLQHRPYEMIHRIVNRQTGESRYVLGQGGFDSENFDSERMFGVSVDVTDRHQALEQIQLQARMLAAVGDAVIATDPVGKIIFWNHSAEKIYGWAAEEVLGKQILDVTLSDEIEHRGQDIVETLSKGEQWTGELRVRRREGTEFPAFVSCTAVFDPEGRFEAIIGISTDLTELRQAEQDRVAVQAQLQQSQKMESMGRLAGGVAHDFNNMLSVIMGYNELITRRLPERSQTREYATQIAGAVDRAVALTRQLLAFASKQSAKPTIVNLNDSVAGMLKMLARVLGDDIKLVWKPGQDLGLVKIDAGHVDQIILNLVLNARDAIRRPGTITIETGNFKVRKQHVRARIDVTEGDYVRILVRDTGSGMDSKTLGRIFEPFFTTKAKGQGTGLGLPTVYGIVKQNGGFVEVDSVVGKGTTFQIYLPKTTEVAAATPLDRNREVKDVHGGVVLLVEDERRVRFLAASLLEDLGYTVLSVGSPIDAIALASQHAHEIRLLLADVFMPEMNGDELAARIRAQIPQVRCLFMSGQAVDDEVADTINNENLLQKPFGRDQLAQMLARVLAGS